MEANATMRSQAHKRLMLLLPLWLLALIAWQPPALERAGVSPWIEAGPAAIKPIQRQLLPVRQWIGPEAAKADPASADDPPLAFSAAAPPTACVSPCVRLSPAAAPVRPFAAHAFRARAPPLV
jgi:hypothetical protein